MSGMANVNARVNGLGVNHQQAVPQLTGWSPADRDPREAGNVIARLQVSVELAQSLRARLASFDGRLRSDEAEESPQEAYTTMALDDLPNLLLAALHSAHDAFSRIEGFIGA